MPITTIKEQVIKIIRYSQGIENPQVDKLIDQWLAAKKKIIEAWDGKYIVEIPEPVSFELGTEEKQSRINEFIDVVGITYDNEALAEFLAWATVSEIFNNKIERDFYLTPDTKITAGTKLIKAFKYFESNEYVLRELQDRLSMIIQEDKVTGTLCFSVHPLDFLSASENTYNWRSCHSLDGDYRAGNLSYLLDSSTIICYLKKEGEMVKLPNFPEDVMWNSKKWRMWLFLSDNWDAMFAGRQYPFFNYTALELVKPKVLMSLKRYDRLWSAWYNDYIVSFPRKNDQTYGSGSDLDGRHIAMRYNIYKMKDIITECDNPLHFNDLLSSSCYDPYYCWARSVTNSKIHFSIGSTVPCLHCNGDYLIYRTNTVMCDPCELDIGEGSNEYFAYCERCDTRQIRDNMIWLESAGELICSACYETMVSRCEGCGYEWYKTELIFDRESKQMICPCCNHKNDEDDWYQLPF